MSSAFRISIGANIVLIGTIAALLWRGQPPAAASAVSVAARSAAPTRSAVATNLQPQPGGPQFTPAAVAELERAGISADAIATALIDDHSYRYDQRVRDLEKKYAPRPVPRREMLEVSRQAEADRVRELKAALGEDGYLAWDKAKTLRMLNMGGVRMDPQEAEQAYHLQKEFDEKNRALQMAMEDGVADPVDTNALYEQAKQQLDRRLEKLLGKEQLSAMRGTPDPIAEVSRRFEDLNPTPEQAQAVLQAEGDVHDREAALVQRLKDNPVDAVTLTAELKALTDAREQNLRQIFGADTYDNTKRQNDPTYQELQQYAGAWDIKDGEIQSVYDTLSAFHDQADRTRMAAEMREAAGQPVNWRDVNAGIDQARLQTEAGLANLIGGERVRRLVQNGILATRGSEIKR